MKEINILEKSFGNCVETIAYPSNLDSNHREHIAIRKLAKKYKIKRHKLVKYKVKYKYRQRSLKRRKKHNKVYNNKAIRIKCTGEPPIVANREHAAVIKGRSGGSSHSFSSTFQQSVMLPQTRDFILVDEDVKPQTRDFILIDEDVKPQTKDAILIDKDIKPKKGTQGTKPILNKAKRSASTGIDNRLVWIMAIACGLCVANLIYAQPLLADMGRTFAVSANWIGLTAALGQIGYALGLIFIVPLGEKYNQSSLVVVLLCAVAIGLIEIAMAPAVAWLILGSCAVGLASVVPELIVPLAASLAPPKERGRVVGTVLCGLFIGTPLGAALSGFVGQYLGWRVMYWIAAGIMIALAVVLHFALPDTRSTEKKVTYLQLLGSLWKLLRSEPVLQEASILGFLVYGAFNAFWVTLSFILRTAPYHYGSEVVGFFGLVGIAGALAALFVGKFADRRDARYANGAALVIILLSFVVMWLVGQWLIALIIGAILLDVGAQSNQVANETRIYSLQSTAWTRLNTIYIFLFCIGGALGSAVGTFSWGIARQKGVYGIACFMLIAALGFYILHNKRLQQWRNASIAKSCT